MCVLNISLAVGSYATGIFLWGFPADVQAGLFWIAHHPVFPTSIPAGTVFGFVVGILAETFPSTAVSKRLQVVSAWVVIVLLFAAFVLWGMPVGLVETLVPGP